MDTLTVLLVLVPLLVSVERSECVRCFAHFNTASGECDAEIGEVPEEDCCQNPHYGYLATDGECRSCGPPVWSPWSSWSLCNTLCGDGVRQKTRTCFGTGQPTCHEPGDKLRMEPCVGTCCEDKEWYAWLPWSPCSVTCGGVGVRNRKRVCSGPPECRLACSAPSEETEKCDSKNQCPVHGTWSSWLGWSRCSGECIDDQRGDAIMPSRTRQRTCSNPAPSTDTTPHGNSCPGDSSQRQDCSELPNCPVDGQWGAWSPHELCSVSCGEGLQLSNRKCNNPEPKYGGKICEGPSTQSRVCRSPCPVHGFWSGWSNWGDCSASCISEGQKLPTRTRHRSCSNPAPSSSPPGQACPGQANDVGNCEFLPYCQVNGVWGVWSPYSSCPVTCGVGLQTSSRKCDSPAPKHGGTPCPGNGDQTKICSTKVHCPVNGVWSEWTKWTVCAYPFRPTNIKCKQIGGSQTRERTCLYQDHGGSICSGDELLQSQVCYYVEGCYIKGNWDGWGEWGNCRPLCGAGSKRSRIRNCKPDYSEYSPTIGRLEEEAHFYGYPLLDCGDAPDGKERESQPCLNAPPCT
ncbi:properdin-like [Odontesthes bonariensis]|uniref:properdin-like n=1 Tax=Odontesthes bonariensis TaxID=219752 RepID=UPI003F58B2BE